MSIKQKGISKKFAFGVVIFRKLRSSPNFFIATNTLIVDGKRININVVT